MIKKKRFLAAVCVTVVLLAFWSLGSWYVIKDIEEPSYQVLSQSNGYEIRMYDPYIVAQTTVSGEYRDAMNDGFREIAGYIFGANSANNTISMTVPVLENRQNSAEKIAMTAPVLDAGTAKKRLVSFVMPNKYSIETLPLPDSDRVTFAEVKQRKVAVLSYGFYANEARIEAKKKELLNLLENHGITPVGAVTSARYNPPFSMPLFLRNEVIVDIL